MKDYYSRVMSNLYKALRDEMPPLSVGTLRVLYAEAQEAGESIEGMKTGNYDPYPGRLDRWVRMYISEILDGPRVHVGYEMVQQPSNYALTGKMISELEAWLSFIKTHYEFLEDAENMLSQITTDDRLMKAFEIQEQRR